MNLTSLFTPPDPAQQIRRMEMRIADLKHKKARSVGKPSERMRMDDEIASLERKIIELRIQTGTPELMLTDITWKGLLLQALDGYIESGEEVQYRHTNHLRTMRDILKESK